MNRPLITVPIGDPAGIGPEIVVKAMAVPEVVDTARVIVTGDSNILRQAVRICGRDLQIHIVDSPDQGDYRQGILNLIDLKNVDMDTFAFGQIQAMCGRAAYEYIEKSVRLAMDGQADAVATTCINKEALRAAKIPYIGHTEIFGALTGTSNPLTMFETNGMRIFFLTRHLSLRPAGHAGSDYQRQYHQLCRRMYPGAAAAGRNGRDHGNCGPQSPLR